MSRPCAAAQVILVLERAVEKVRSVGIAMRR